MNLFNLFAKITLDTKDYDKNIINAEKKGSNFSNKLLSFGKGAAKGIGAAVGAIGAAVGAVTLFSIKSAMELEASEAKYKTVFDGFVDISDEFIKKFQQLTPATTSEARNMASGIQDMLIPMGFLREEATEMTGAFMHISGALTNFNSGTETAESVTTKVTAALTGELSGLKSLGIQLDADTVKRKAVEKGYAATTSEVDKQAQAMVILEEMYNQSGDALAAYNEESLDAKTKFELLKKQIGSTAEVIGTKFLPAVNDGLGALKKGFEEAIPFIDGAAEGLSMMIEGTEEGAEIFKENITILLDNLLNSLVNSLPKFMDIALQILLAVVDTILANLPTVLQAGLEILTSLIKGIAENIPQLVPIAIDTILQLTETLLDNTDLVIDAAFQLIMGLIQGIFEGLPVLLEKAPIIIIKTYTTLLDNLPKILKAGVLIVAEIGKGLINGIPELVKKIPQVYNEMVETFKKSFTKFVDIGKDVVKGIWEGIKGMKDWLKNKITGFGSSMVDGFKSFFKIGSPSKLFADEIGANLAKGIDLGFTDEMQEVNNDIERVLNTTVSVSENSIDPDEPKGAPVIINQTIISKEALSPFEIAEESKAAQERARWALA